MKYSSDLNNCWHIAPDAEVLKLTVSHMCLILNSLIDLASLPTHPRLLDLLMSNYRWQLWQSTSFGIAPSFPGSPRTVKGEVRRLCSEFRCASTLQLFHFVVQAHCSASTPLCMHTAESLGVSHALGKVQSGLQSITQRKTSKMSLTRPMKRINMDKQERKKMQIGGKLNF